jgi:soluble lytic murein transglycosylase-like protein
MKIIKLMLLSFAFISQVTVFASYAPYLPVEKPVEHVIKPKIDIRGTQIARPDYSDIIEKYSFKFDVSPVLTARIIYCESRNNSYAVNDTPGVEFSVGLVHIKVEACMSRWFLFKHGL